jgi:DNA-binding XRE family transcriptional regulator
MQTQINPETLKQWRRYTFSDYRNAAREAGCRDRTWTNWEQGRENPSAWWLSRICLTLSCTQEDLQKAPEQHKKEVSCANPINRVPRKRIRNIQPA